MVATDPSFCPACGTALGTRRVEGRDRASCPSCDEIVWRNPVPTAAVAVVDTRAVPSTVLLVRREHPPDAGEWGLPAGFLEYGEHPREAAVRELHEETGLRVAPEALTLFDVDDLHHPTGRHLVTVAYVVTRARTSGDPVAGSDALDARFVSPDGLAASDEVVRAFDHDRIRRAIDTVS